MEQMSNSSNGKDSMDEDFYWMILMDKGLLLHSEIQPYNTWAKKYRRISPARKAAGGKLYLPIYHFS